MQVECAKSAFREPGANDDFFHPQIFVGAQHLVQKSDHLRSDHRRYDAHAAGEVRGDDAVSANLANLLDVVDAHAEAPREDVGRTLGRTANDLSVYLAEASGHIGV